MLNPVTYVIINIAIVILVYSGGVKVNIGDLTQGQVVALYNYMSQILVELIKLANLLVTITKALASADRIKNVFEQKSTLEHNFNDKSRILILNLIMYHLNIAMPVICRL